MQGYCFCAQHESIARNAIIVLPYVTGVNSLPPGPVLELLPRFSAPASASASSPSRVARCYLSQEYPVDQEHCAVL